MWDRTVVKQGSRVWVRTTRRMMEGIAAKVALASDKCATGIDRTTVLGRQQRRGPLGQDKAERSASMVALLVATTAASTYARALKRGHPHRHRPRGATPTPQRADRECQASL